MFEQGIRGGISMDSQRYGKLVIQVWAASTNQMKNYCSILYCTLMQTISIAGQDEVTSYTGRSPSIGTSISTNFLSQPFPK